MSSMRWTEEEYAAYVARRRTGDDTSSVSAGALPPDARKLAKAFGPPQGEGKGFEPNRRGDALIARENAGTKPGGAPGGIARETPARPTKYGNRRTEVDGKRFDSKHEAEVYQELMLRVRAGELRCVARQVAFDLPGGIRYIADFVVIGPDYRAEVIDAKSPATRKNRVYINKKKQMASEWGIEIREV